MAHRGSSDWAIEHYGKPCISSDVVRCEWYPGLTENQINVHDGTQRLWQALGAVMLAYNYVVPTSYVGAMACRPITGGTSWSRHSWPLAMDVNAATNPYIDHAGTRTIRWGIETDMPASMIREIESITAGGIQAFTWGGRWNTLKDAMHFQVRVTLQEIAKGVKAPRGFYEGGGSAPGGEELSQLRLGNTGNAVEKHQKALNVWNDKLGLKTDGVFGEKTDTGTKQYQKAAEIEQNGVIDGVTSSMLMTYLTDDEGGTGGKHSHVAEAVTTVKIGVSG